MKKTKVRVLLAVLSVMCLLAVGCGKKDDGKASSTPATSGTPAAASAAPSATPAA